MSGHLRALVLLVAFVAACGRSPSASAPAGTARPPTHAASGTQVSRAAVAGAGPGTSDVAGPAASGEHRRPRGSQPEALQVLHRWDRCRARAYAGGSPAALRALYAPGSGAGRADVRLLRRYAARGYRVEGMRMQVLGFRVLAHAPGRWRLLVTDRLAGAVAVRGGVRTVLPRDRASTRVVALERGDDGVWRVAAVSRER